MKRAIAAERDNVLALFLVAMPHQMEPRLMFVELTREQQLEQRPTMLAESIAKTVLPDRVITFLGYSSQISEIVHGRFVHREPAHELCTEDGVRKKPSEMARDIVSQAVRDGEKRRFG